ncbi:MAG: hypothetical protein Q8S13_13185, partial [Dehalococcoidia bacterium]|nr:hypothetical protein [Dehalococcoidia bacterium]
MRLPAALLVVVLALLYVVLASSQRAAQALPPAGTGVLPVVVTSEVASLLGDEQVVLKGWLEIDRSEPYLDGGVEVVDLAIVNIELVGATQLGLIEVDERAAAPSSGEIRSLQPGQDFPASSFLDLFVEVSAPASPFGPLLLHNEMAMRLTLRAGGATVPVEAWPPLGVTYELEPIFGVDNDGDGEIDEDTPDDDGDGRVDEDRPGPDPDAPLWEECGDDADCDSQEGEDPPVELCSPALCDADDDGQTDEDPACVPLLNDNNTHLKFAFCARDLPLEVAPELPSYSVARDGPAAVHPADILALAPPPGASGGQAPVVRIACASLGLTPDGCDDGADGDQDDLDALSYGDDLPPGAAPRLYFSVAPGAIGAPGSAVEEQQNCPPAQPGLSPEPQGDEFGTGLDGTNDHVLDG